MFGRKGKARYLGLPGNPVASLVCSHVFLKPLLEKLSGRPTRADVARGEAWRRNGGERPAAGLYPRRR